MTPLEVVLLADQIQAHLTRGDFAAAGPVDLGPDGIWDETERVARIVLADVAHCSELDPRGDLLPEARWQQLMSQLTALHDLLPPLVEARSSGRAAELEQSHSDL